MADAPKAVPPVPTPPPPAPKPEPPGPAQPAPGPVKADADRSPGPEFVKMKWVKPVGNEPVGKVEWTEHRRAASLVAAGHGELVKEEEVLDNGGFPTRGTVTTGSKVETK